MARGKSSRGARDISTIANDPLRGLLPAPRLRPRPLVTLSDLVDLTPVQDLRRFHPLGDVRARVDAIGRKADARRLTNKAMTHIGFDRPYFLATCIRRRERREVLFAKKRTRKGAGARRRRQNFFSKVRC